MSYSSVEPFSIDMDIVKRARNDLIDPEDDVAETLVRKKALKKSQKIAKKVSKDVEKELEHINMRLEGEELVQKRKKVSNKKKKSLDTVLEPGIVTIPMVENVKKAKKVKKTKEVRSEDVAQVPVLQKSKKAKRVKAVGALDAVPEPVVEKRAKKAVVVMDADVPVEVSLGPVEKPKKKKASDETIAEDIPYVSNAKKRKRALELLNELDMVQRLKDQKDDYLERKKYKPEEQREIGEEELESLSKTIRVAKHYEKDGKATEGPFTTEERRKIQTAVDEYLFEHSIPREDVSLLIHPRSLGKINPKYAGKHEAFARVIRDRAGVNRAPFQLYNFMKLFFNANRAENYKRRGKKTWTDEQDEELKRLIALRGLSNWAAIENEMGKHGAKDRWDCIKLVRLGAWTAREDRRLLKAAKKIMKRDGITDILKFNGFTEQAAYIKTRSYKDCQKRMKKLVTNIRTKDVTWELQDYKDLLTRMIFLFSDATDESEIKWDGIASESDCWTPLNFSAAWRKLLGRMEKEVDISDYTFRGAISYCIDNLRKLAYPDEENLDIEEADELELVERPTEKSKEKPAESEATASSKKKKHRKKDNQATE